jgi:hypothetical protein
MGGLHCFVEQSSKIPLIEAVNTLLHQITPRSGFARTSWPTPPVYQPLETEQKLLGICCAVTVRALAAGRSNFDSTLKKGRKRRFGEVLLRYKWRAKDHLLNRDSPKN